MVYQDREPLYFYDLAVHGAFAFLILVFLLNIFASSINSFFREHKRSITFRLSFSLLKKNLSIAGLYWALLKLCCHFDGFARLNKAVGVDPAKASSTKHFLEAILAVLQAWAIILQLHYIDCSLIAQRACAKHASSETKLQKAKGAKAPTKTLDTELLRYEKARTVFQCTAAAAATSTTVQSSTKVSLSQYMRALTETYLHELFSLPWTFMYIVTMTLWVLFLVLFNSPQLDFFRKNVVFNNTEFLLKALALALALTLVLAARLTMFLMSRKKPFLKSTFSVVEIVKVLAAANSALILGMGLALHYFYTESLLPVFGVSLSVSIYLGICAIPGIFNALPYYSVVTLREVDSTIISNLVKKNN